MFFSIKEVSEKLGKSEEEIHQLVKDGRLREFRDGPNLLFKVDEVSALMSDTSMGTKKEAEEQAPAEQPPEPQLEENIEMDLEPELEAETPVEPMLESEPEIEPPAEPMLEEEKIEEPSITPEAETPVEPILEEEPQAEVPAEPATERPVEPTLEAEPEIEPLPEPKLEEEKKEEPAAAPVAETPVEPTPQAEPQAEAPAEPVAEAPAPAGDIEPPAPQKETEEEEILLAPDTPEKSGEEIHLTDADTQIVDEGIKVLGESDTADALGGDTGGETFKGLTGTPAAGKEASLEEIEKDVSLDTFGSGSGLLDLSLQADDTSLGGILDEIYTTPGGAEAPAAEAPLVGSAEGSAMEVAAEADQILADGQFPEILPTPAPTTMMAYTEPAPDAMSNAMGVMLFIPVLAVIYTAIVAIAGFSFTVPTILKTTQGYIWYITGGLAVASLLIAGIGATMSGEKKPKAPKVKKQKPPKVKKEKPPKPKKEKKKKK